MSVAERSKAAIPAFRKIISELRKSKGKLSRDSPEFNFLMQQFRTHQTTQKLHLKAPHEAEHIAASYATYLHSTRILTELQQRYNAGERSVEESARLVGLSLPEKTPYNQK